MGGEIVGILNIPGKGSVNLLYLGDDLFGVDVPGTPPLPLERVRDADGRGLIAWHRPDFLHSLDAPPQTDLPVADDPLAGVDLGALGDEAPAGHRGAGTAAVETLPDTVQPAEEASGISEAKAPLLRFRERLSGIFRQEDAATPLTKAIFGFALGLVVLVALGFVIWQSMVAMGRSSTATPSSEDPAALAGKAATADAATAAEDSFQALQQAIASRSRKAYDRLADSDAITADLADAYAARAREAQGLSASEARKLRAAYLAVLRGRESAAVSKGLRSSSLLGGDFVALKLVGGKPVVLVNGGGIPYTRTFSVTASGSGYRFTGLANAAEVVGWMDR